MILQTETRKIIAYDFCPRREYLVAVSNKVKSFSKLAPVILLKVLFRIFLMASLRNDTHKKRGLLVVYQNLSKIPFFQCWLTEVFIQMYPSLSAQNTKKILYFLCHPNYILAEHSEVTLPLPPEQLAQTKNLSSSPVSAIKVCLLFI